MKTIRRINLIYINQLCKSDVSFKNWFEIKNEFGSHDNLYFKCFQIINSLPLDWKRSVSEANNVVEISTIPQVGILQCTRLIPLENLASKQIYSILIRKRDCIPTAKLYFDIKFPDSQNIGYK